MLQSLLEVAVLVNRYIHIVCTTVLVGGTLFYEMIVPVAIGDLKQEQQLLVFGRARWTFKGVVWTCAVLLLISGVISSVRRWTDYATPPPSAVPVTIPGRKPPLPEVLRRPGWWWASHAGIGAAALVIAVVAISRRRPPDNPIFWMRVNFLVLLIVIFLASAARHMRLMNIEAMEFKTHTSSPAPAAD